MEQECGGCTIKLPKKQPSKTEFGVNEGHRENRGIWDPFNLFSFSGSENPIDDCPFVKFCLHVCLQLLPAVHSTCLFFPILNTLTYLLLYFVPPAFHVADLHELHLYQCHPVEKHCNQQITL